MTITGEKVSMRTSSGTATYRGKTYACGGTDTRTRLTQQCIESFYAHTPQYHEGREACDLTVVDDASEPAMEILLRFLREKYNFTLVRLVPSLGGGFVTNLGAFVAGGSSLVRGEFLYHSASDFYFGEGWLEALLDAWPTAETMGIGLLGAWSHPFHLPEGKNQPPVIRRQMVAAGSWFMKWETWDEHGPLNTLHRGLYVGSEDTEFNFSLIEAGIGRGTIWPEKVIHTGRTNSEGKPTLGADYMPDVEGVVIE